MTVATQIRSDSSMSPISPPPTLLGPVYLNMPDI
eukprot:CAMPEP_0168314806 /NCGR_PEP_ID=MMETSP0210-20121227/9497_1 /TAXON_ID=40633 /ORGANISM="Condylostoma magnum, Strain COL2" /LENGTH=33 /DNA_ID= /DNA_START= /DNA_END= /DNA_ORIENTATION=